MECFVFCYQNVIIINYKIIGCFYNDKHKVHEKTFKLLFLVQFKSSRTTEIDFIFN